MRREQKQQQQQHQSRPTSFSPTRVTSEVGDEMEAVVKTVPPTSTTDAAPTPLAPVAVLGAVPVAVAGAASGNGKGAFCPSR